MAPTKNVARKRTSFTEKIVVPPADAPEDKIESEVFKRLRDLLYGMSGIDIGSDRSDLVTSRLAKRLRALHMKDYRAYLALLNTAEGQKSELPHFVNALTTNKTEFVREKAHFDHLTGPWLRETMARIHKTGDNRIRIWCAASSTGQEPYTIAMALRHAIGPTVGRYDIKILASDINTDVLRRAVDGTFDALEMASCPRMWTLNYFDAGPKPGTYRIKPDVRMMVQFRQINLTSSAWPIKSPLDIIFCRNVMIYFNDQTRNQLTRRFVGKLKPNGLLIISHSESIEGFAGTLKPEGNSIYRKVSGND